MVKRSLPLLTVIIKTNSSFPKGPKGAKFPEVYSLVLCDYATKDSCLIATINWQTLPPLVQTRPLRVFTGSLRIWSSS